MQSMGSARQHGRRTVGLTLRQGTRWRCALNAVTGIFQGSLAVTVKRCQLLRREQVHQLVQLRRCELRHLLW